MEPAPMEPTMHNTMFKLAMLSEVSSWIYSLCGSVE
jgi:hypothetical protein